MIFVTSSCPKKAKCIHNDAKDRKMKREDGASFKNPPAGKAYVGEKLRFRDGLLWTVGLP